MDMRMMMMTMNTMQMAMATNSSPSTEPCPSVLVPPLVVVVVSDAAVLLTVGAIVERRGGVGSSEEGVVLVGGVVPAGVLMGVVEAAVCVGVVGVVGVVSGGERVIVVSPAVCPCVVVAPMVFSMGSVVVPVVSMVTLGGGLPEAPAVVWSSGSCCWMVSVAHTAMGLLSTILPSSLSHWGSSLLVSRHSLESLLDSVKSRSRNSTAHQMH